MKVLSRMKMMEKRASKEPRVPEIGSSWRCQIHETSRDNNSLYRIQKVR